MPLHPRLPLSFLLFVPFDIVCRRSAPGSARHRREAGFIELHWRNMAKEEMIEFEGIVDEVLPDARFRVTLKNGHGVMAYSCGKMRRHGIRILAGDRVTLEMTPYDLSIARITFRHKDEAPSGSFTRRPYSPRR
jgi:translation initiation factor IF-1